MLHRTRAWRVGDRLTEKIADAFTEVLQRSTWAFDHVAVDVNFFAAAAARLTRDLTGLNRDQETVKLVHRQLTSAVLRRLAPRKSLAVFMDGSGPLWAVQRTRAVPGKYFDSTFYRSAASPMVYQLEESLTDVGPALRPAPMEFLLSGPGSPGPAEAKLSAWLLDLATRAVCPAQSPAHTADVSAGDAIALVGGPELSLVALGATPFAHLTTITWPPAGPRALTLAETLEWLGVEHLPGGARWEAATLRTEGVLLYLLTQGHPRTDLAPLGLSLREVMRAYLEEVPAFRERAAAASGPADGGALPGILLREHPVERPPRGAASLRLEAAALARVLVRAAARPVAAPARACRRSAAWLEVLLQTHALFCTGAVPHLGWTPPQADGAAEKSSKLPLDALVGHLRHLAATHEGGTVGPTRDRRFALTGLETLLLTAPHTSLVEQILPVYTRGHRLPDGLAQEVVQCPDVHEALSRARAVLPAAPPADSGSVLRQAFLHSPSHYIVRSPGSPGPPVGWTYHSVNLGLKAEAMNIRYAFNAGEEALERALELHGRGPGDAPPPPT